MQQVRHLGQGRFWVADLGAGGAGMAAAVAITTALNTITARPMRC